MIGDVARYILIREGTHRTLRHIYLSASVLIARSREVSKTRDSGLDFSNRFEISQAPRQQRCRDTCQISERYDHYNTQSRGFEPSRDLAVRRPST